jgi:hypothetical protein
VTDIEDRLRAALRKQAEAANRALRELPGPKERTFRPVVRTLVAAVTAGALVAGVTAAGIWIVRNRAPEQGPADQGSATPPWGCPVLDEEGEGLPESYRSVGDSIEADLRGDGRSTRAVILGDEERPSRCRYILAVEEPEDADSYAPIEGFSIRVRDLPDVPALMMAVEIDGEPGLEVLVDFGGPMHPHRAGQIFTFDGGSLVAMRTEQPRFEGGIRIFFPLGGEFSAGVDCAGESGAIVVTEGGLAEGGTDDSHYDVTRTFYRASGAVFIEIDRKTYTIEVGSEEQRWPEVADDPFRSCPGRVG